MYSPRLLVDEPTDRDAPASKELPDAVAEGIPADGVDAAAAIAVPEVAAAAAVPLTADERNAADRANSGAGVFTATVSSVPPRE